MNKYIIGLIVAIPGWYLASFIGKLASQHAERFDKKIKKTKLPIILSKLVQPLIIFICVILAINFFPPKQNIKQQIENIASSLNRTEKSLLTLGFQTKYKCISEEITPEQVSVVQNYLNEIGKLPNTTAAN